jgi:hypothetical protein
MEKINKLNKLPKIQTRTNTRINLRDRFQKSDSNGDGDGASSRGGSMRPDEDSTTTSGVSQEKVLVIRGSSVNVQRAELEIKKLIVDIPIAICEEYFVPEFACGRIIGRGGATIKCISTQSNCVIKLTDRYLSPSAVNSSKIKNLDKHDTANSSPNKKVVSITGGREQINLAKELISAKIKEELEYKEKKFSNSNSYRRNSYANNGDSCVQRQSRKSGEAKEAKKIRSSPNNVFISREEPSNDNSAIDSNDCDANESSSNSNQATNQKQTINVYEKPKVIDLVDYLDENRSVEVFVSAVAHPHAFWIQVCGQNWYRLLDLLEQMNSYYDAHNMKELFVSELILLDNNSLNLLFYENELK